MNHVILAGPALAVDPNVSRFYSVVALRNTFPQLASIEVSKTKELTLRINTGYGEEECMSAIMAMVVQVVKQYSGQTIKASGTDAICLATGLNAFVASTDANIVKAWTTLNFAVEAVQESTIANAKATSVRFVGTNISGLKAITSATTVTFSISAK
jgi:hypothetical protein